MNLSIPLLLLSEITLLLLIATLAQRFLNHSPALRHALLLWTFVAIGLCSIMAATNRFRKTIPLIPLSQYVLHSPAQITALASTSVVSSPELPIHSSAFPSAIPLLLTVWASGTVLAFIRLAFDMRMTFRIRRAAAPLSADILQALRDRLQNQLGRSAPALFTTTQSITPASVGFFRPMLILPLPLFSQLDDRQLLQVLTHESAHAFRRDSLVGLYQRIVTAAFWFHPLIYLANRQLDRAREQLCDNHVLAIAPPTEYARTLLTVAQSISPWPKRLFAAALFPSASQLEIRIKEILSTRRSIMTHVNISKFITIAAIFSAMGIGLGCLGASPATQTLSNAPALPHIVKFDAGATQLLPGDNITITDIHGTADTITPGNIYCIKGTYTLASHDKAMLAAFTTAKNANEGTTPYMQVQTLNISKGDASFTLYLPMAIQGWPHISFYSVGPGQNGSFSGVYFGTGDSLLKKWWGTHEATDTVGTAK